MPGKRVVKGWLGAVVCVAGLGFWAVGEDCYADLSRVQFKTAHGFFRIDVLSPTLFHCEFATLEDAESDPAFISSVSAEIPAIGHSPMVLPQDVNEKIAQSALVHVGDNFIETDTVKLLVDPNRSCVVFTDLHRGKILTQQCVVLNESGELTGFSLTQEQIRNTYGLGEQFVEYAQDLGWVGRSRTSPQEFGNSMVGFQGGGVGNAQFPMMYAIGADGLNYGLFVDKTEKLSWDFKRDPWQVTGLKNRLRFYFIHGANLKKIREQYMDLVGHPPVPPKKILGLWVSEFGYKNWGEVEDRLGVSTQKSFSRGRIFS